MSTTNTSTQQSTRVELNTSPAAESSQPMPLVEPRYSPTMAPERDRPRPGPQAGEQPGQAGGPDHFGEELPLAGPQQAHAGQQGGVHPPHAGVEVEDEDEKDHQGRHNNFGPQAQAEPDDEHRPQGQLRQTVEPGEQGGEGAADSGRQPQAQPGQGAEQPAEEQAQPASCKVTERCLASRPLETSSKNSAQSALGRLKK